MSSSTNITQSLEQIDSLPAMPTLAQKILTLQLDTDEGETQLLKLIAQDPQVSAKLIGLSNTALFGAPGMITSINDAAMRLGLTLVKTIAIGMASMSSLSGREEGKIKAMDLWTHSMAVALAMKTIARYMPSAVRPSDDQIFLAGLLHDIGYNVLSYLDVNAGNALYDALHSSPDKPALSVENDLLGTHHCEIGARLATHWGLPEKIIAVIRYHHTPEQENAQIAHTLVNLVNVAEKMLGNVGFMECAGQAVTEQEWTELRIDPGKIDEIMEKVSAAAEQAVRLAQNA